MNFRKHLPVFVLAIVGLNVAVQTLNQALPALLGPIAVTALLLWVTCQVVGRR